MKGLIERFYTDNEKTKICLKLSPMMFDLIVGNNSSNTIIEFGEYPIAEVDDETQIELNTSFSFFTNKPLFPMKETGRFFIIKHNIYHKDHLFNSSFTPTPFYTYLDKKHFEYEYKNKKYIYNENEKKWIEVQPIRWRISRACGELNTVDLYIPLPLIVKTEYYGLKTKPNIEESRNYIFNIVFTDIFKTVHLSKTIEYKSYKDLLKIINENNKFEQLSSFVETTFKGIKLSDDEKENVSKLLNDINYKYEETDLKELNPNDYINNIIDKIYDLLELNIYDNKEEVISNITKLIKDYNNRINNTSRSSILVLEREDIPFLYNKLTHDLNDILDKLSFVSTKNKDYIEMLQISDNCIRILSGEESVLAIKDIEKDILKLKEDILPSINCKTKDIIETFEREKQRIISYIKDNNNVIKEYKTKEEFDIFIRKELQSFLLIIKKELDDNYVSKQVQDSYNKIMEGIKVESKNHYFNILLNEIQSNINFIQRKGSIEDNEMLSQTLQVLSENNNEDFTKTISKLSSLLKDLYKLKINMENETNNNDLIRKYTVSIKEKA